MSDDGREAALKVVQEWLESRDWVGMVRVPTHPHEICSEVADDLATFILRRESEAKIEALEWAMVNAQPYGGTGIAAVIEAEIARLKGGGA